MRIKGCAAIARPAPGQTPAQRVIRTRHSSSHLQEIPRYSTPAEDEENATLNFKNKQLFFRKNRSKNQIKAREMV
jgi:hypothetical protein